MINGRPSDNGGKVKNIGHERLDEIFGKNSSMNGVYHGDSREIPEVFYLADHPIIRHPFSFGKKTYHEKEISVIRLEISFHILF
jgi:hypothetical protein